MAFRSILALMGEVRRTRVERCELCGAPLRDILSYVVWCDYCHEENRLVSKERENAEAYAAAVTKAAEEARTMAQRLSACRERLESEFGDAMLAYTNDPSIDKGHRALHAYEALLRIIQAPSVHMAQAMGPQGESVMRQIDESVANAISTFAQDQNIMR